MEKFQRERRFRRRLISRPVALLLLIILVWSSRAVWVAYRQRSAVKAEERASRAELSELLTRRISLQTEIAELETPGGVERAIRRKFSVVAPGERVVVVESETGSTTIKTSPWWLWLAGWFKSD